MEEETIMSLEIEIEADKTKMILWRSKQKQNKYSKARPNWVMKKPAPMGYHEKEDLEEKISYRRR